MGTPSPCRRRQIEVRDDVVAVARKEGWHGARVDVEVAESGEDPAGQARPLQVVMGASDDALVPWFGRRFAACWGPR